MNASRKGKVYFNVLKNVKNISVYKIKNTLIFSLLIIKFFIGQKSTSLKLILL
ncbi:hypothetical protein SNUCP2_33490 [Clostridium perfringens A]|nr:hypothetical protein CPBEC3_14310 [Clostridium perfringens]